MLTHATFALVLGCAVGAAGQSSPVPADLSGDGAIDGVDLVILLSEWGPYPPSGPIKGADFDGNRKVDGHDLGWFLESWAIGPSPGPGPVPILGTPTELAGHKLAQYPFFNYVRAINQGTDFHVAIDPTRFPGIVGDTCRLYVVKNKSTAQWAADPSLIDLTPDGFQVQTFVGGTIQAQTFQISGGSALNGTSGTRVGIGYDVVFDCNQNAVLDNPDFIDGLGAEGGMYVVRNTAAAGPYAVAELNYDIPNWTLPPPAGWGGPAGYQNENIFYPSSTTSDILLPLIVVSRGNGHNHNWYDHIGNHMGSYGYVVMSHNNQTEPGVEFAATTTLLHTDAFIAELPNIAGGVLDGRVDTNQIVWIGHSRGGEGVTIAYDRLFDGVYTPINYSINGIRLVSSIAPVDFLGGTSNPGTVHGANYHLWTGGSDADVNGCASCNLCQTFHLHDRAEQFRQSISLHGVGHGDFHNGGGSSVATGPCLVGRPRTHQIMLGYLLPLVKRYLEKDIPSKDFLWRQWESFKPIGAPAEMPCLPPSGTGVDVVVDLMYRDGPSSGNFMIDDFETQPSLNISSSGGNVIFIGTTELIEGIADDNNFDFTWSTSDLMNSSTIAGTGDTSKALAATWNATPASITWRIIAAQQNFTDNVYLSFRIAQASRHPNTVAVLADLTFKVELIDVNGAVSAINLGAFGGGIEEPYQRTSCGVGAGWAAEFEVIRIRLTDFLNNGSGVLLNQIAGVRFNFGDDDTLSSGRVIIDELEVTRD